jgi:predicted transcriptional regulator
LTRQQSRVETNAQAATDAAPQARQVADRWHLLKNVREVIERLFERQAAVVGDALKSAETDSGSTGSPAVVEGSEVTLAADQALPKSPEEPAPGSSQQEAERAKRRRRVERFERAHELSGQGISVRQIAHELDLSRNSVRRYLRLEVCPDWGPGRTKRSGLDAHQEWIDARLAEGCENASELHRELVAKGLRLSYGSVAAVCHEATEGGRQESPPRQRSQGAGATSSLRKAIILRLGPQV